MFTLDENFAVFVNSKERESDSVVARSLLKEEGKKIRVSEVPPLADALLEHWIRVDLDPIDSSATPAAQV
jgi:hypothetical protein